MFLLNSRYPQFYDTLLNYNKVPFLPKLQGYFAEFLQFSSFKRLGTFIPTHLCRF